MEVEDYLPPLIRASLDNDLKMVRSVSTKIIRHLKKRNPEVAVQISEALNYHGAGLSSARSIGYGPLPQDQDSRSNLLVLTEPLNIQEPIFEDRIDKAIQRVIDERRNLTKLVALDLKPTSSILLYGAPGVGKTFLAQYLSNVFQMKLATLDMSSAVSSYLGKTGQNLKKALDYAKEEPTVLLLDEFDAIAKRRDDSSDLGELKRVVNVLLKELEDWPSHSILIAATNHPELIDKAMWRRFDIALEVPLPNLFVREKIFEQTFSDTDYVSIEKKWFKVLSELTEGMSPADIFKICEKSKKQLLIYGGNIEKILISEVANARGKNSVEFNKKFCKIAKNELGMTYREMAGVLDKSISAIQNYLKGSK